MYCSNDSCSITTSIIGEASHDSEVFDSSSFNYSICCEAVLVSCMGMGHILKW